MTTLVRTIIGATILTLSLIAGQIPGGISPSQATPRNASYISVGDSFTANLRLLQSVKGLITHECLSGSDNYASIAGRLARVSNADYSCNGSSFDVATKRLAQAIRDGKLGHGTKTVSLLIGYTENWGTKASYNYGNYIAHCIRTGCQDIRKAAPSLTVRGYERKAQYALDIIRGYAPNAQVIFLSYPTMTTRDGRLCTPQTGAIPRGEGLRHYEKKVSGIIRAVAARNNAKFLDVYTRSQGHGPCDNRPWVEGLSISDTSLPLHSNPRGHRAIGRMLAPLLKAR